ncbi:NTP transferase domain-containing protein [Plantibacter sp. VKM Ac-2880]|uniref:molybdenum cofactor guanylyltransferase n=1 Tax=Plantibacter sp. VKM Ac-2880 TaxID=2783827 RepID=UPI00188F6D90|nr:NTP transferase domain-containing protein [Plantibacter sp. VKM Ac-2880]MBF4567616.1 NTP transferase domain-containing protein [Plantibacter sp. VKM Ac-2880]
MPVDAIILAGGRSSRLGGVAKASLLHDGRTLLQLAIEAARLTDGAIVVVGPDVETTGPVRFVREHPAFGGPAAAIAAGLDVLREPGSLPSLGRSRGVAILACDMPGAAPALAVLLETAALATDPEPGVDGWIAVDAGGRDQPLLGVYRSDALERRVAELEAAQPSGDLTGVAVRHLLSGLELRRVAVPEGGSADVDTWADAAELGVVASDAPFPTPATGPAPTSTTTTTSSTPRSSHDR